MVKLKSFQHAIFAPLLVLSACLTGSNASAQSGAKPITIIAGGQVKQPAVKTSKTVPDIPKLRPLKSLQLDRFDPVPELLGGPEVSRRSRRGVLRSINKRIFKPSVLKIQPSQSISN